LSPYEIGLFDVFGDLKPKSFFEDGSYQVRIVAFTDEDLKSGRILVHFQVNKQMIAIIDGKQKLPKLLQFDINGCLSLEENGLHEWMHSLLHSPIPILRTHDNFRHMFIILLTLFNNAQ
jgi:hypothetical protein